MNKPWWLWEGVAVRVWEHNEIILICEVESIYPDKGTALVSWGPKSHEWYISDIEPIENPAITLAPEGATHVLINEACWCYYLTGNGGWMENHEYKFHWPQCPEHLKGTTQELPR